MALVEIDSDGNEVTADFLRRRGLRDACRAEIGMRLGNPDAEAIGRAALGDLVDAFLHDRQGNAGLFVALLLFPWVR